MSRPNINQVFFEDVCNNHKCIDAQLQVHCNDSNVNVSVAVARRHSMRFVRLSVITVASRFSK